MASMTMASKANQMDNLLIKCIFFTNEEFGWLGSFFLRYKYSAI